MSVSVNTPQIQALRESAEKVVGKKMSTFNDFLFLVNSIESSIGVHVSESTLERLWGYSTRMVSSVSKHTLDVVSKYVGAADWPDFCRVLKEESAEESEEILSDTLSVNLLSKGDIYRLGWQPDRLVLVKYLGNFRFEVISSENSKLRLGDRFSCLQLQKDRPLYLDNFCRKGDPSIHRFVVGERNGLTVLEKI